MRRLVAALLTVAALVGIAACATSQHSSHSTNRGAVRVFLMRKDRHRLSVCASADCGPDVLNLDWAVPAFPGVSGYYITDNGTQIADVTSSPYVLVGLDCGTAFTFGVQPHNSGGGTGPLYTTPYTTPSCSGGKPVETGEPVISGTVATGDTLSTTNGTWGDSPTSYSYQWQDCATDGTSCSNITGATSSTYKVVAGDAGHTIEAVVTATNASGNGTADAPIVPLVDNFGGSSVDTNVWGVLNQQGDTSNGEIECYEPSGVTEGSNQLTETISYNSSGFTCPSGTPDSSNPLHYLSGDVYEKATQFQYGTVVVKAKVAGGSGSNSPWPAIWMLGGTCQTSSTSPFTYLSGTSGTNTGYYCPWPSDNSDSSEIDIEEFGNTSTPNENVVNSDGIGTHNCTYSMPGGANVSNGFHTYEMDWTSTAITFKVDGTTTSCGITSGVPTHPMFLIIDTAAFNTNLTATGFPATTTVDYVHVSH